MGYQQSNQQTPFIGYPQNQIYNPADLQYMQDMQQQFMDWGPYQPGMTKLSQWDPNASDPSAASPAPTRQRMLTDYFQRVGDPYEQSQRQAYWEQMGGQNYGGVLPPSYNSTQLTMGQDSAAYQAMQRRSHTPWGDLNNMGISSAYGMPTWQQDYFGAQNSGQGEVGSQAPIEQFNLVNSGGTNMSPNGSGLPSDFMPADQYTTQTLQGQVNQVPGFNDPQPSTQGSMQPAAPSWMNWQPSGPWGGTSNPWGHSGGWGGQGWGH